MNLVKTKEKHQPQTLPCIDAFTYKKPSSNERFESSQGGLVSLKPKGTQTLPSTAMTSTRTSYPPLNNHQYYREMQNFTQPYCLPVFYQEGPFQFSHDGTQYQPPATINSIQTPQPPPHITEYNMKMLGGPQENRKPTVSGPTCDITACPLLKPSSTPYCQTAAISGSSSKSVETILQQRKLRREKNREAAQRCRQKKKEYVRCLENYLAVLEKQNNTLTEELRALKAV